MIHAAHILQISDSQQCICTAIDAACLQIDAKTINAAHILQIDGSHSAHGGTIKEKLILHTYCRSIMVFQACPLYP